MADLAGKDSSWDLATLLASSSSLVIRAVSFTCLALGTILILPFVSFVLADFFLWIWRHYRSRHDPQAPDPVLGPSSTSLPASSSTTDSTGNASIVTGTDRLLAHDARPRRKS